MRIEWSEQSRRDLRGILSYVGMKFGRRKAGKVLSDIRERVELLKVFPNIGRKFVDDPEFGITYRVLTDKMNRIVYFVDEDRIVIVTVWQNRQDINRLNHIMNNGNK